MSKVEEVTTRPANETMIPTTRTPLTAPINRWLEMKIRPVSYKPVATTQFRTKFVSLRNRNLVEIDDNQHY